MIQKRKAKVVFYSKTGTVQILLGRRKSGGEEFWWIPGGSIEGEEDPIEALRRELEEEMVLTEGLKRGLEHFKDSPPNILSFVSGKTSYLIYFIETPKESTNQAVLPVEEFDTLQWFKISKLPENLSREFEHIRERVMLL